MSDRITAPGEETGHTPCYAGVRVLDNGQLVEALDEDDFYSGCYGAAAISLYPYNSNGNHCKQNPPAPFPGFVL